MPLGTTELSFTDKTQADINKTIMKALKEQQMFIQILFNRLDGKEGKDTGYIGPSVYRKYGGGS